VGPAQGTEVRVRTILAMTPGRQAITLESQGGKRMLLGVVFGVLVLTLVWLTLTTLAGIWGIAVGRASRRSLGFLTSDSASASPL
jgi:hypothetical protein